MSFQKHRIVFRTGAGLGGKTCGAGASWEGLRSGAGAD